MLWFIPVLFVIQQIANFIIFSKWGGDVILLVLAAVAHILVYFDVYKWAPFPGFVSKVAFALIFFAIGSLIKVKRTEFRWSWVLLSGLFCLFAIGFMDRVSSFSLDMARGDFGFPVIALLSALAFSYLVFGTAVVIDEYSKVVRRALIYAGSASMVIYYLHQPIHCFLKGNGYFDYTLGLIFVCILGPLIAHALMSRNSVLAFIFLGRINRK